MVVTVPAVCPRKPNLRGVSYPAEGDKAAKSRSAQPPHQGCSILAPLTFGAGWSFAVDAVLCFVGCSLVSVVYPHRMPVAPRPLVVTVRNASGSAGPPEKPAALVRTTPRSLFLPLTRARPMPCCPGWEQDSYVLSNYSATHGHPRCLIRVSTRLTNTQGFLLSLCRVQGTIRYWGRASDCVWERKDAPKSRRGSLSQQRVQLVGQSRACWVTDAHSCSWLGSSWDRGPSVHGGGGAPWRALGHGFGVPTPTTWVHPKATCALTAVDRIKFT